MIDTRQLSLSLLILISLTFSVTHSQKSPEMRLLNKSSNLENCQSFYRQDETISYGPSDINLEIANDEAARQKGLGGRDCIRADEGMLFVFDQADLYPFWMKDMKFPIDMIWIDQNKKVVHIEHEVEPSTYPKTFVSSVPAKYVLELKSGSADDLKIYEGAQLVF